MDNSIPELSFIYRRHSVRKFQDTPIPENHIREIIKAATYAPSGKNLQNWHFIVITNKVKIAEIAHIVETSHAQLVNYLKDEAKIKTFKNSIRYCTFFKNAPALVLVYAGPYETIADMLLEANVMPREDAMLYTRPNPGMQNIGAAMENLLLAAANLGYGTCWMTGPTFAAEAITAYLDLNKPGFYLAAMSPLGLPADNGNTNPPRKPLEEVFTLIR